MNKNMAIGVGICGGLLLVVFSFLHIPVEDEIATKDDMKGDTHTSMSIPQDIPSFPIYPNIFVENVDDVDSDTARDISLSLNTAGSAEAVNTWYREQLSQNGWSIKSDTNVAGYQIIQGEKDTLYTSIQATKGSEAGTVNISQHLKVRK